MTRPSIIRISSATIAAAGLSLVVTSINVHGDKAQLGVSSALRAQSQNTAQRLARERASELAAGGGLEMVEFFQCMCAGPIGTDIRGWVGLWIVSAIFGGVPTAVLLRSNRS